MLTVTGTLKVKSNEQKVSEKFRKRDFVVTDNSSQYPQHIMFQLTQDRCGLIEQYKVGDEIKVAFNLRGREWTSPQGEVKYFNTLEAWKIEGGSSGSGTSYSAAEEPPMAIQNQDTDDLPF